MLKRVEKLDPGNEAGLPADAHERLGKSVSLRGLQLAFGQRKVLENFNLDVPAQQFIAVVGRSGVGKSSLDAADRRSRPPTAGEVLIDDKPVTGLQKSVRLMFQDARLLPWQSVLSNVGIARGPAGRRRRSPRCATSAWKTGRATGRRVLSGGQRQRVALARVLVGHPSVLLLDEPFGALDALTRAEMHALLEKLWQKHLFTTVLITHDVAEAVALGDRVVVVRDGRVTFDVAVTTPRPRRRTDVQLAALQAKILAEV
ncbi:MAG: ABC transporter ATP-binding protein [Hyphomicrobium sp.]